MSINSGRPAKLVESLTMKAKAPRKTRNSNRNPRLAARVERALLRAGEAARCTARMHGTPLYVWENGRVVAKRP